MAVRRVQLRRGNTAENNAFTGAVGEVTVDTQTNSIRVHDNDQAGGFDLMRADMSNNASITSNIGVTGSIIIGPALGANTITLGQATSTISIPGTLNVNIQNTTQDLAVQDRAIILASGNEGNPHTDGDSGDILSLGLIFTRTLAAGGGAQDEAVFFWDEEEDRFKLGINAIDGNSTEWNTGLTTAGLLLGSLDVDNGNITNVGNIALDTISAATDGNTIGMTLKQAGGATAFTIVDDDAQGANTFLTINATDGADSVTIDATSFVVNSTISLDNTVVINDAGADKDFRVEGSTEANLLFVDASADSIGIGKNNPSKTLDVTGTVGISSTLDVAGKSTLTGSLDLTTASSNGITFRSEIAENGADADATLLRVNIGGTDGGGNPNYKAVSWDADTDRFTFDTNAQILNGGLVLGDGTNATTISVPDQTAGNTAGENLTISAGVGAGTGAGGSLIFQTGADNAGALSTVLTLDKDNKATFTGNIDFSNGTVLGGSVGNGHTLNLGGHVGSTTNVAGILQVTSNTIKSSGATAITLSSDDVTVEGDLSITGASSQKVNLGATNDGTAFEIAMQPRVAGGDNNLAGANLTITAGRSVGNANGGSIIFRTSNKDKQGLGVANNVLNDLQNVLTLDTAKLATFGGDIDFSDGTILGASVGNTHTLTLGGHTGSTTTIAGKLKLGADTIQASDGANTISINSGNDLVTFLTNIKLGGDVIVSSNDDNTITLDEDDVTVLGGLTITGTDIASDGSTNGQLIVGAVGANAHFSANSPASGGGNAADQASGNFIISTGKSTGTGAGGSIIFQTSESAGASANTQNSLQTVLTLDKDLLATFAGTVLVEGKEIKLGTATGGATKIEVEGQGDANTAGHDLTISAGAGRGNGEGGSLIFQTAPAGAENGGLGTVATALEIFHDKRSYFSGNIDFGNNTVLGGSVGAGSTLTLGGDVGSTTNVAGILQVTSNTIKSGSAGNPTAITLSEDDVTVEGDLSITGASSKKVNLGASDSGTAFEIAMQPRVADGGNDLAGANLTFTAGRSVGQGAGGSIIFRTSESDTEGVGGAGNGLNDLQNVLALENQKVNLGAEDSATAFEIAMQPRASGGLNANDQAGADLTITAGRSVGTGAGGSILFKTSATGGASNNTANTLNTVLELDTAELATFSGNVKVDGNVIQSSGGDNTITLSGSNATILGDLTVSGNDLNFADNDVNIGAAVDTTGKVITIGGATDMITKPAGILRLGADTIQASDGANTISINSANDLVTFLGNIKIGGDVIVSNNNDNTITLDEDDVTVLGNLNVTGTGGQKVNLGAEDSGTAFEIAMQPRVAAGDNNLAGANLTITAGRSVGNANGGSIIFRTSNKDKQGLGVANNVLNDLQTVLTLDTTKKATFAGNVQISGNLEVDGTTTQIDSTISTYVDPMILLNSDKLENSDTGIFMGRHANDGHNVAMYWDNATSEFTFASVNADASDTTVAVDLSAQNAYALQPISALSIGMGTTDTTASNTIQTRNANAFVVKDNTDGANTGNNLVVNTASGQIETLKIVPINHNTHDIGADDNRFVTGYFASLDTTSNVQFDGTVSLGTDADNQDKDITVVARTGADKTGNDLTITAGQSTGTGAGGSLLFKTSETGGASNADANALQTVLTLDTDNLATFGDAIKIGGNSIQNSSGTEAIALSANNATTTISATTTKTSGDLTVEGRDVVLGTAGGGDTTISVPTSAGAGHALTISSGLGNNAGVNDGSLILRSGSTAVLTLDTNELATFAGNIKVGTNVIQSSGGQSTITLSNKDATVLGGLTITGEDITPSAGGLGGAGQLVIGAGAGADSHLTATHSIGGGANDIASGNFIISAGKSVGNGAGGSIVFQTSTSGAGNGVVNALQTVLTLDKDLLATFAGDITVTGNTIKSSVGDAIQFTGTNTATKGDLTVEGRDVVLGTAGGGATTISVPQSGADSAGHNLTISAGQGNGAGRDGGILAFQTGGADGAAVANALSLGADKKATFAGAIDVASTSILRGNTSLYSGADLFVYSDAGNNEKFSVDGATGNTSIAGTLGVTGITTLDDTLKIKTSPTDSVGILFNSDTADADITLLKVNDTTANVQLDWDDSESSFVVKGGKLHLETDFSVGGTITTNPNFKVDSSGNVTIKGTLSTTSASGHVSFRDRIIALATNSASATNDIGFYGLYKNDNVNEVEYYSGLIYNPVDTVGNNGKLGVWKLFHSESIGADAVNITVEDTNLGVLDISELRGGSALGNNDTAGANLTISGGKSTGSATGGGIVFKTGGSGAGAAVENAPTTALTIDNAQKTTLNVAGAGLDITKTTGLTGDEQTNNAPLFSTNTRAFQVTMTTHTAIADDAHSIGFLVNNTSVSSSSVIMATVASATNGGDILTEAGIEVYAHSLTNGTSFEFSLVNRTGSEIATDSAIVINFVIL